MSEAHLLLPPIEQALQGLAVSHVWRGHGSAIILEFGVLTPSVRRDGSNGEPAGQYGLMIQWSWRIEDQTSILCGSWSDEALWEPTFQRLLGRSVTGLAAFGRLPEISLSLEGSLQVVSFQTSDGDPQWALFDRTSEVPRTIFSRGGRVLEETADLFEDSP